MNRVLVGFVILSNMMLAAAIPGSSQAGFASANSTFLTIQQKSRLTLGTIEELIQNKTPDNVIADEIRDRGIAFRVTDTVLASLERLGAGPETLRSLRGKMPKKQPPLETGVSAPSVIDKLTILVTNFGGPDQENYRVTDKLIQGLNEAASEYSNEMSIQPLKETITEQGGSKSAHEIGARYKANIVLWGYYGATSEVVDISAYFEILRGPKRFPLRRNFETQTSPIIEMKEFRVQTGLSKRMTYLALLTIGLTRFESGDYEGAIIRFTRALDQSEGPKQIIDPTAVYFFRGLAYYQTNRVDDAIADFGKLIKLKPAFAHKAIQTRSQIGEAYYNRGFFYLEKGEYKLAIADFDKAVQLESDFADVYITRGFAYIKIGKYDQGITDSDKAIKLKPNLAAAYNNRGEAYRLKRQHSLAIADFDKALELNPYYAKAYNNRGNAYDEIDKPELAIADYNQAIKLKPDYALAYHNRAIVYQRKGAVGSAIADYDTAIKLKPDFAEAYLYRGRAYSKKDQYDRAIADYDAAIRLKPELTEAYLQRGAIYSNMKRYELAIADYSEAIKRKPDYVLAYYVRAIAHQDKGELALALADYNEAIKLNPYYVEAYRNSAELHTTMKQYESAIAAYEAATKITRDDVEIYLNLGLLYERKKQYDRAIAVFGEVIKRKPDYAAAYYLRALAYQKHGDLTRAVADYNKAIELKPDHVEAHINRGIVHTEMKQYDRALADYDAAIKMTPNEVKADYAAVYYLRALVYEQRGELARAIEDLRSAARITKDPSLRQVAEQKLRELGVK